MATIRETRYTGKTLHGFLRNAVLRCDLEGHPRSGQPCVVKFVDGAIGFRRAFKYRGEMIFICDDGDAWLTVPVADAIPIVGVRADEFTTKPESTWKPSLRKILAESRKTLAAAYRCLKRNELNASPGWHG